MIKCSKHKAKKIIKYIQKWETETPKQIAKEMARRTIKEDIKYRLMDCLEDLKRL